MIPTKQATYMPALTTRQRDILQILLQSDAPIATTAIARRLDMTARQINYSLKGIQRWLGFYDADLKFMPGVGVELVCDNETHQSLLNDLSQNADFQLILSAEQRRQILAYALLNAPSHHILDDFQAMLEVSRTTILKDLESLTPWFETFGLSIERKANYGTWLSGTEQSKRYALSALYSGDTIFTETLWQLSYTNGLQFNLSDDIHLLPILHEITLHTTRHDVPFGMEQIARAEATTGMRFSDHAVLHIALALAIQEQRTLSHQHLSPYLETDWLKQLPIWTVARDIAQAIDIAPDNDPEIASIAQHLLAAPKTNRWQGDTALDTRYPALIKTIMRRIAEAYELPALRNDPTFRDGLTANLIPATLRNRFRLYLPQEEQEPLSAEKYAFEHQVAHDIITLTNNTLSTQLPDNVETAVVMLLRAAYIRVHPKAQPNVIVVCPSGMATAQLLVARLKARFPRLGDLTVVSVREIQDNLDNADLIITTVPLPNLETKIDIVEVHPHLSASNVAQITEWLAA